MEINLRFHENKEQIKYLDSIKDEFSFEIKICQDLVNFEFRTLGNLKRKEYDKALSLIKVMKRIKKFKMTDKRKENLIKDGYIRLERKKDFKIKHNFTPINIPLKENSFSIHYSVNENTILVSMLICFLNAYIHYIKVLSLNKEPLSSRISIESKRPLEEDYFSIIRRMEIFFTLYSKALFEIISRIEENYFMIQYIKYDLLFNPNDTELSNIVKSSKLYKNMYIKKLIWEKWRYKNG